MVLLLVVRTGNRRRAPLCDNPTAWHQKV